MQRKPVSTAMSQAFSTIAGAVVLKNKSQAEYIFDDSASPGSFGEAEMKMVVEKLPQMETQRLIFREVVFTPAMAHLLGPQLSNWHRLDVTQFEECTIPEETWKAFSEHTQGNRFGKNIRIIAPKPKINPKSMEYIGLWLQSRCERIYLSEAFGPDKMGIVAQFKHLIYTQSILLPNNGLTGAEFGQLASELRYPGRWMEVDLSDNPIDDKGLAALGEGLCHTFEHQYLLLAGTNVTGEGMENLLKGWNSDQSTYRNIKKLHFGSCAGFGDLGCVRLGEAITAKLSQLRELNLTYANITGEGLAYLCQTLANHQYFVALNVNGNAVGDQGGLALRDLILTNCITILDFEGCGISQGVMRQIAVAIAKKKWLHSVSCQQSDDRDKDEVELAIDLMVEILWKQRGSTPEACMEKTAALYSLAEEFKNSCCFFNDAWFRALRGEPKLKWVIDAVDSGRDFTAEKKFEEDVNKLKAMWAGSADDEGGSSGGGGSDKCFSCRGAGTVKCTWCSGRATYGGKPCTKCSGGKVSCKKCGGSGRK